MVPLVNSYNGTQIFLRGSMSDARCHTASCLARVVFKGIDSRPSRSNESRCSDCAARDIAQSPPIYYSLEWIDCDVIVESSFVVSPTTTVMLTG